MDKLKRPKDFEIEYKEKTFVFRYNPNDITIEQAEPAIAIAFFMADVNYNMPETAYDLIKSKAHRWVTEIMKYLLFEVENGKQLPFNISNIDQTADLLIKMPSVKLQELEECVSDFLSEMNRQEIIFKLRQTKRNQVVPALAKLFKNTAIT